jgi:hypothetical protein
VVQYAITITFVVVALAAVGLIAFTRHESRPAARPSLAWAVRTLHRSPLVVAAAAGECPCGGVLGATGRTSRRYGPVLACTDCGKTYTEDGRRIVFRRRPQGARRVRQRPPVDQ